MLRRSLAQIRQGGAWNPTSSFSIIPPTGGVPSAAANAIASTQSPFANPLTRSLLIMHMMGADMSRFLTFCGLSWFSKHTEREWSYHLVFWLSRDLNRDFFMTLIPLQLLWLWKAMEIYRKSNPLINKGQRASFIYDSYFPIWMTWFVGRKRKNFQTWLVALHYSTQTSFSTFGVRRNTEPAVIFFPPLAECFLPDGPRETFMQWFLTAVWTQRGNEAYIRRRTSHTQTQAQGRSTALYIK